MCGGPSDSKPEQKVARPLPAARTAAPSLAPARVEGRGERRRTLHKLPVLWELAASTPPFPDIHILAAFSEAVLNRSHWLQLIAEKVWSVWGKNRSLVFHAGLPRNA